MPRLIICCSFLVPLLFLWGCESYDFTVNDKLVYTPKHLFSDFDAPDPALYACIRQAIIDAKVTASTELSSLNCSHAGIENLEGLEAFTGLLQLKLSSNKIRNLSQITALKNLQALYLDDNVVVDPVPLYQLSTLRVLDLSANALLQCPKGTPFGTFESLSLPEHCT